jgi:hypothetical protein
MSRLENLFQRVVLHCRYKLLQSVYALCFTGSVIHAWLDDLEVNIAQDLNIVSEED